MEIFYFHFPTNVYLNHDEDALQKEKMKEEEMNNSMASDSIFGKIPNDRLYTVEEYDYDLQNNLIIKTMTNE